MMDIILENTILFFFVQLGNTRLEDNKCRNFFNLPIHFLYLINIPRLNIYWKLKLNHERLNVKPLINPIVVNNSIPKTCISCSLKAF